MLMLSLWGEIPDSATHNMQICHKLWSSDGSLEICDRNTVHVYATHDSGAIISMVSLGGVGCFPTAALIWGVFIHPVKGILRNMSYWK